MLQTCVSPQTKTKHENRMRVPIQSTYEEFVPRFLRALFAPEDRVVICRLIPRQGQRPAFPGNSFPRDDAFSILFAQRDIPNIYFRASAHDGSENYGKENCVRTQALFLDIDYGTAGHKKMNPFRTQDDAMGYLLTLPIPRPSIAWNTGHGIQACYLLEEPFVFPPGGGDALSIARYENVSSRLSTMGMSDDTFTPEHAFRVPLSWNDKAWQDPALRPVQGEVLWIDEARRYAFEELEAAVAEYGIEEHLATARKKAEDDKAGDKDDDEPEESRTEDVPYENLPEDIRNEIAKPQADRSVAMFDVIRKMVGAGYGDKTILDAIGRGRDYQEKYGDRLDAEVDRCIQKVRGGKAGKRVYGPNVAPPIEVYNVPVDVGLEACAALPKDLEDMLGRYGKACDEGRVIELGQRVLDAARFHEHMFQTQSIGVLESPCGSGKSTWAISHIALNASESTRYLYVTETIDALYNAAELLEKLTKVSVGRVHGFNKDKCKELCGTEHDWHECYPKDPKSKCRTCEKNAVCAFYNRDDERKKPIVCLTHSGLVRAIVEEDALLEDASILIDEGLDPFATIDVRISDLKALRNAGYDLSAFFPYSSFACATELDKWDISAGADVFASRNYVYRNEQQAAALRPTYDSLRQAMGRPTGVNPFAPSAAGPKISQDALTNLLNFFRPSKADDATYAYRETRGKDGAKFSVKRKRFQLEVPRRYRKLWMLNASAQLCPFPYPDNLKVYSCPGLPGNSDLVTLHVVRGNPTKSNLKDLVLTSEAALWFGTRLRKGGHGKILVVTNKIEEPAVDEEEPTEKEEAANEPPPDKSENIDRRFNVLKTVLEQIQRAHGAAEIVHLTRGRIKGVNTAGGCTLAYVSSMATFTTVDDCALHTALHLCRTYPDRPYVYHRSGGVNWPGGRPIIPAMRQFYALLALDEIYQAIWRTAVRNNERVEAIIGVPEPEWLVALWRTVMPCFTLGLAFKSIEEEGTIQAGDRSVPYKYDFAEDPAISGLSVICNPPGTEIQKKLIAEGLGYTGKKPWKENKVRIRRLLGDFFGECGDSEYWRRK